MKCYIEFPDFDRVRQAITPEGLGEYPEYSEDNWQDHMLRAVADNGTFSVRCPFGEISVPARVERPGAIFVPLWEFLWTAKNNFMDLPHREFDLMEDGRIVTNDGPFMFDDRYAVFDDPADAPEKWEDVEFEEPEDEDGFDEDDADGADEDCEPPGGGDGTPSDADRPDDGEDDADERPA